MSRGMVIVKSEIIQAAMIEIEQALANNADLLLPKNKRTLNVKLAVTKIEGGHRVAGSCVAGGRKHFSFGTIITDKPEEL